MKRTKRTKRTKKMRKIKKNHTLSVHEHVSVCVAPIAIIHAARERRVPPIFISSKGLLHFVHGDLADDGVVELVPFVGFEGL